MSPLIFDACNSGEQIDCRLLRDLQEFYNFKDLLDLIEIKNVHSSWAHASMKNIMEEKNPPKPVNTFDQVWEQTPDD